MNKQKDINYVVSKNLITISETTTAQLAQDLMTDKRIRHLPVIDSDGSIVGVISDRDLANLDMPDQISVGDLVSSDPEFVSQNEALKTVILRMIEKKISSVLITDDNLNAIGIITTDDLLWCYAETLNESQTKNSSWTSGLQLVGDLAQRLSNIGI